MYSEHEKNSTAIKSGTLFIFVIFVIHEGQSVGRKQQTFHEACLSKSNALKMKSGWGEWKAM
jgi:hypothetical protein